MHQLGKTYVNDNTKAKIGQIIKTYCVQSSPVCTVTQIQCTHTRRMYIVTLNWSKTWHGNRSSGMLCTAPRTGIHVYNRALHTYKFSKRVPTILGAENKRSKSWWKNVLLEWPHFPYMYMYMYNWYFAKQYMYKESHYKAAFYVRATLWLATSTSANQYLTWIKNITLA